MELNQFIISVKEADWHSFEDVPNSLIALAIANQESKDGIYQIENMESDLLLNAEITNNVLSSVGNNHAGTYFPIVLTALPYIVQIALYGNHALARNCAINILIDLYYFCPDSTMSEELETSVKRNIETAIAENIANFEKFAVDDSRNKSLIESLIGIIE